MTPPVAPSNELTLRELSFWRHRFILRSVDWKIDTMGFLYRDRWLHSKVELSSNQPKDTSKRAPGLLNPDLW